VSLFSYLQERSVVRQEQKTNTPDIENVT